MKQLLFTFLLLPFYCSAQLEAGINGGVVPYAVSKETIDSRLKTGDGYDISLSYKCMHRYRMGLGYNAATLPATQGYTNGLMPLGSATLYYAKPLSSIYLFADREFGYDHIYFNIGVNLGAAFLNGGNDIDFTEGAVSASGIAVGVHAGCSYDFYKGLCANVQAGITDAVLNANRGVGSFTVTTFPMTIGLHYKLHLHRHKGPAAK